VHVWKLLLGNVATLSGEDGGFTLRVRKPDGSVVAEARWKSAATEVTAVASVIDAVKASLAPPVVGAVTESVADAVVAPVENVTAPPAPGPRVNLDLLLTLKPGELYTFLRGNDMGFPSVFVVRILAAERSGQSAVLRVELHGNPRKPRKEKGEKRLTLRADDSSPVYVWGGAVPGVIAVRESLSVISGFDDDQITEIAGKAVAEGASLPIVSGPVGAAWRSPLREVTAPPSDFVREAASSLDRAGDVRVLRIGAFFSRPDSPLTMEALPDDLRARVDDVMALGGKALVDDVDRVLVDLEALHAAKLARVEAAVAEAFAPGTVAAPRMGAASRLRDGALVTVPDGDAEDGSEEDGPTRRAVTIETIASSEDAVARMRLAGNVANVFVGAVLGEVRRGVVEPSCEAAADGSASCHWRLFVPWTRAAVSEDDIAVVRLGVEHALSVEGVVVLDPGPDVDDAEAVRARVEAIRADTVRSLAPAAPVDAPAAPVDAPAAPVDAPAANLVRVLTVGLKLDNWQEVMSLLPGGSDQMNVKGARSSRLVDVVIDRRVEASQEEYDDFVLSFSRERPAWLADAAVVEITAPGRNRIYARTEGYPYARYVGFDVGTTAEWNPDASAYEAPSQYVIREGVLSGSNLDRLWKVASDIGRTLTFLHAIHASIHSPVVSGRIVLTIAEPPERTMGEGPMADMIRSVTVKGRSTEKGDVVLSIKFPGAMELGGMRSSYPLYVYDGDVPIVFPPRDCYDSEKALHVAAGAVEAPPLVAGYCPGAFAPSLFPPEALDPRNAPENRPLFPVGSRVALAKEPERHGVIKKVETRFDYNGNVQHSYDVQTDPGKLLTYVAQSALEKEVGDPPAFAPDITADISFHSALHTPHEVMAEAFEQSKVYDREMARKSRVKSDATRKSAQADADLAARRSAKLVDKLRVWGQAHPEALNALLAGLKGSTDHTKQAEYSFAVRAGLRIAAPQPGAMTVTIDPAVVDAAREAVDARLPREVPPPPEGSSASVEAIGIYISKKTGKRRVAVRTVKGGECAVAISAATRGAWHWSRGMKWWSTDLDMAHGPNTAARRVIAEFVPGFNPEGGATFAFGDSEEGGDAGPAPVAVEPVAAPPASPVATPKIAAVARQYLDAFVVDVTWEDGARYMKKEVVRGKEGRAPVDATGSTVAALLGAFVERAGARVSNVSSDYRGQLPDVSGFSFGMRAGPVVGGDFAASAPNWRRIVVLVTPPLGSCQWTGHTKRKTGAGYASSYEDVGLAAAMEFVADAYSDFMRESIGWDGATLERNRGVLAPQSATLPWPEVMVPAWTTAKRSEDYPRTVHVEDGFVSMDGKREYMTSRLARAVLVHRDDVDNQLYRYNRVGTATKMNPGEIALSKMATLANTSMVGRGPLEAPASRLCATLVEVETADGRIFAEMARWSPGKAGDGDWTDEERRVIARALTTIDTRSGGYARLMVHYLFGDQLGADGRTQEAGYSGTVEYFDVGETTATKLAALATMRHSLSKRADRAVASYRDLRAKVEGMADKAVKAEFHMDRAAKLAEIDRDIAETRERITTGSDAVSSVLRDLDMLMCLGVAVSDFTRKSIAEFAEANGAPDALKPRRPLVWVHTSDRRMIFFIQGRRSKRLAAMERMRAALAEYKTHTASDAVDGEASLVGRTFGDQTYRFEVMAAGSNAERTRIFSAVAVVLLEALVSFGTEAERAAEAWEVESLNIEERSVVRLRQIVRRKEGEPVIDDSSFASPLPAVESVTLLRDFDLVMLSVVAISVADVPAAKRALSGARQGALQLVGNTNWADVPEPFVAGGENGPTPRDVRVVFLLDYEALKHNPEQGSARLDAAERALATFASSVGLEAVYRHAAAIDDNSVIAAWCASNQRVKRATPIDAAALAAGIEKIASAIVKGRWEYLYTYSGDNIRLTPAMRKDGAAVGRDNDTPMISDALRGVTDVDVGSGVITGYNREDRSTRLKWAKGLDGERLRRFLEDRIVSLNGFAVLQESRYGRDGETVAYYRRPHEMQGALVSRPGDALTVPGIAAAWPGNSNIGTVDTVAISGSPLGLQVGARRDGFAMVLAEAGVNEAARAMLRELSGSAKATMQVVNEGGRGLHPAFAAVGDDFRTAALAADGGRVAHVVATQHHPGVGDDFDSVVYLADETRDVVCPVKGSLWAAVVNNVDPDAARFVEGPEDRLKSSDRHGGRGRISARDPASCVVLFKRNKAVAVVYPLAFSESFPLRFTAGPTELKAIMPKIVTAPQAEDIGAPPTAPSDPVTPVKEPEPVPAALPAEPSEDDIAKMLDEELGL